MSSSIWDDTWNKRFSLLLTSILQSTFKISAIYLHLIAVLRRSQYSDHVRHESRACVVALHSRMLVQACMRCRAP